MVEELQSLSETNKKRVLVIGTIIIMVIVIGVWFAYFNSIIIGSSQPDEQQANATNASALVPTAITPVTTAAVSPQANGPSLWQDVKNGFGWFGSLFSHPSQYKIQPK
jgi:flagellar basal body-associated protein FliL